MKAAAKADRVDIWSTHMPIVVGLVGVTDGLEVCAKPEVDVTEWYSGIEIDPAEVVLTRDRPVYLLHRRSEQGRTITWVGAYRKSFEMGRQRPGAYVSAGLWITGSPRRPVGAAIVSVLSYLLNELERLTMVDGRFMRRIASVQKEVDVFLEELASIRESLGDSYATRTRRINEAVAYVDANEHHCNGISLEWLLDWALGEGPLFGEFSRVVIGVGLESFANGERSSLPLTPFELLKRATQGRVEFRDPQPRRTEPPKTNPSGSYEQKAEAEQEMVAQRRPVQAPANSQGPIQPEPTAGHTTAIDYPDYVIEGADRRQRSDKGQRRPIPLRHLIYACVGLLAAILAALVMMSVTLSDALQRP